MDDNYEFIKSRVERCSISRTGKKIYTYVVTFPRYILPEVNTHRALEKNAQSSRAIPVKKLIKQVRENPVMPIRWGSNQSGMVAKDVEIDKIEEAKEIWRDMARYVANGCEKLEALKLHKQWSNRPMEPFMTITVIITGTEWENFFALRTAPDAQPEFQYLAKMMLQQYKDATPNPLEDGEWHLPFITEDDLNKNYSQDDLIMLSAGRCARVSYLSHEGVSKTLEEEVNFANGLLNSFHMTPFGQIATPDGSNVNKCLVGWKSYRGSLPKDTKTLEGFSSYA